MNVFTSFISGALKRFKNYVVELGLALTTYIDDFLNKENTDNTLSALNEGCNVALLDAQSKALTAQRDLSFESDDYSLHCRGGSGAITAGVPITAMTLKGGSTLIDFIVEGTVAVVASINGVNIVDLTNTADIAAKALWPISGNPVSIQGKMTLNAPISFGSSTYPITLTSSGSGYYSFKAIWRDDGQGLGAS